MNLKSFLRFENQGTEVVLIPAGGEESPPYKSKRRAWEELVKMHDLKKVSSEDFARLQETILKKESLPWDEKSTSSETNLFTGTLLEEVLNFKGEFLPVKESRSFLLGEQEFDVMREPEKTLHTLAQLKIRERNELIKTICGVNPGELKDDTEIDLYDELLQKKATREQKVILNNLGDQANFLSHMMMRLIRLRVPSDDTRMTIAIRPGFKLVKGVSVSNFFDSLFAFAGDNAPRVTFVGFGG